MRKSERSIIRAAGTVLIGMGVVLMLAGLWLFLWNRKEAAQAEERAAAALAQIKDVMAPQGFGLADGTDLWGAEYEADGTETDILTVTVDEYEYMGYLSIPALGLELPVMAQWSYPRLKIAPCRYYGSPQEENLVIAAHNYPRHFGGLAGLEKGAEVIYVDMEGKEWRYGVEAVDVLAPEAVEEMTEAGYALTLFTCTYGGANRVTVRCGVVSDHVRMSDDPTAVGN